MEGNKKNTGFGEPQSIDIVGKAVELWDNRKLLIKWCIIGAVIGLVAAFSIPKTYRANAVLAPETQQRIGSGVSSIASMMGVSLDNSMDAIDVEMYPDVVASTPFLFKISEIEVESRKGDIKTTLKDYIINHQKMPWWSHILRAPMSLMGWIMDMIKEDEEKENEVLDVRNLPKDERKVIKYLASEIEVEVDKKTGKTLLTLEMQDPLIAATVLEEVVQNLKEYMSDYRTSKSRQDVENLTKICAERKAEYYAAQENYAKLTDANKNVVMNSTKAELQRSQQEVNLAYQVYSQVATQLEGARIKVQQSKPVFVVLHPVSVPLNKSALSKSNLLHAYSYLAGCCSEEWLLYGRSLLKKFRNK